MMATSSKKVKEIVSLTPKEKRVLEYIEGYIFEKGISPTFEEIRKNFKFASINSVQNYIKQLKIKKYLNAAPHGKRGIVLLSSAREFSKPDAPMGKLEIPLLGKVAAGRPIEARYSGELLEVEKKILKNYDKSFALQVEGESMIQEGIIDGDYLIVEKRQAAKRGDLVVARVDEAATVKRYFPKSSAQVELRPSHPSMKTMVYPSSLVAIEGVVVGLIRKF